MKVRWLGPIYDTDLGKIFGNWPGLTVEASEEGDSRERTLIVFLGTKNKREGRKRAAEVIRVLRSGNAEPSRVDRSGPAPDP